MTDAEIIELARKYTFFNGSHALTNYPMLYRAIRALTIEECAAVCESLSDDHIAGTRNSENPGDWCFADGSDCEFVLAWQEGASAIRSLAADISGEVK